ncbi:MAG: P1 family peptidase [Thermovirgaceae bacterium]|nr:P1 family peptidase [Thermovirgaceae bacterium]
MWTIGHAQDHGRGTGCTVLIFPEGATASCDVRGGAPGTRETALLAPECLVEKVTAIVLSGGSARGLAAADGVMRFCEDKGWGFDTGFGIVPIIPAACLFDLSCGDPDAWPDPAMGREASISARSLEESPMGNVGAGTGATVGKYTGLERAMKSGFGWCKKVSGSLEVSAVVAVNAFGAVRDASGKFIAGALDDGKVIDPRSLFETGGVWSGWGKNTTIGVVVTNASLDKSGCRRVAIMGHTGLASAIFPVHTPFDGDTLFCAATAETSADTVLVGTMAAAAMAEAVQNAVLSARKAYGLKSALDISLVEE